MAKSRLYSVSAVNHMLYTVIGNTDDAQCRKDAEFLTQASVVALVAQSSFSFQNIKMTSYKHQPFLSLFSEIINP